MAGDRFFNGWRFDFYVSLCDVGVFWIPTHWNRDKVYSLSAFWFADFSHRSDRGVGDFEESGSPQKVGNQDCWRISI